MLGKFLVRVVLEPVMLLILAVSLLGLLAVLAPLLYATILVSLFLLTFTIISCRSVFELLVKRYPQVTPTPAKAMVNLPVPDFKQAYTIKLDGKFILEGAPTAELTLKKPPLTDSYYLPQAAYCRFNYWFFIELEGTTVMVQGEEIWVNGIELLPLYVNYTA